MKEETCVAYAVFNHAIPIAVNRWPQLLQYAHEGDHHNGWNVQIQHCKASGSAMDIYVLPSRFHECCEPDINVFLEKHPDTRAEYDKKRNEETHQFCSSQCQYYNK